MPEAAEQRLPFFCGLYQNFWRVYHYDTHPISVQRRCRVAQAV